MRDYGIHSNQNNGGEVHVSFVTHLQNCGLKSRQPKFSHFNVHKNVPGTKKLYNLFPLLFSGMDNSTEEDKEQSIDVATDAGALDEVL